MSDRAQGLMVYLRFGRAAQGLMVYLRLGLWPAQRSKLQGFWKILSRWDWVWIKKPIQQQAETCN